MGSRAPRHLSTARADAIISLLLRLSNLITFPSFATFRFFNVMVDIAFGYLVVKTPFIFKIARRFIFTEIKVSKSKDVVVLKKLETILYHDCYYSAIFCWILQGMMNTIEHNVTTGIV